MFKYAALAVVALFTETQAIQVKSQVEMKSEMRAQIDSAIDSYLDAEEGSNAEWGFLKNIVNIDKFFDSGVKAWTMWNMASIAMQSIEYKKFKFNNSNFIKVIGSSTAGVLVEIAKRPATLIISWGLLRHSRLIDVRTTTEFVHPSDLLLHVKYLRIIKNFPS